MGLSLTWVAIFYGKDFKFHTIDTGIVIKCAHVYSLTWNDTGETTLDASIENRISRSKLIARFSIYMYAQQQKRICRIFSFILEGN